MNVLLLTTLPTLKACNSSGVLRPGSLTKLVIWVLNLNASLDSFQIQHLDNFVQRIRQNHKILIILIRFPMSMRNTEWSGKVTKQVNFEKNVFLT